MAFTTLISTEVLQANLHQPDWVIFDCRSSLVDHNAGKEAYQKGHIPQASYCHLDDDLSSRVTPHTGRHPLPDFKQLSEKLGNRGVGPNTQVVAYDDAGGAYAVRLWWQLRTFGHEKVAVLDGGIPQWIAEGKALTQDIHQPRPQAFTPRVDTRAWLETQEVFENLADKSFKILDARTPERFRGESEPIDPVAGRIPGSLNRPFQANLNEQGLFHSPQKLHDQFASILQQVPENKAENIVHLCGSGVTACHNQLAMEIAGLSGSKLYIGSWSEWITDPQRPIATG